MRLRWLLAVCAGLGLLTGAEVVWAQSAPDAPAIGTVTAGTNSLTIAWTAPGDDGGEAITAYDLQHRETAATGEPEAAWILEEDIWTTGGGDLTYALTGLEDGVSYDLQIRAVNSEGESDWTDTTATSTSDHGDSTSAASSLVVGSSVQGRIGELGDEDYFTIVLTEATDLWVYTTGLLDTEGALLNSSGIELRGNSDGYLFPRGLNFSIRYKATAGTYYLRVAEEKDALTGAYTVHARAVEAAATMRDAADGADAPTIALGALTPGRAIDDGMGDANNYFRFELTEAADLHIMSISQGGQTRATRVDLVARLLDDGGDELTSADDSSLLFNNLDFLIRKQVEAGTYYLHVDRYFASEPIEDYVVYVEAVKNTNRTLATARELPFVGTVPGRLSAAREDEYFRLTLLEDTHVSILGYHYISTMDLAITRLDEDGNEFEVYTHPGHPLGRFSFRVTERLSAGTHYFRISSPTNDTGAYLLQVKREEGPFGCPERSDLSFDPLYGCQWHLNATGQYSQGLYAGATLDINVEEVWDAGILGEMDVGDPPQKVGVGVAVVEGAMDYLHSDLRDNVDTTRNLDFSGKGIREASSLSHATAVAGLIAARDNDFGVRGVAPRAQIYNYYLLVSEQVQDVPLAQAMLANSATTAVSNNSWGFTNTGLPEYVPDAWEAAIENGLAAGFGGKGVSYVWAAGNGHLVFDHSNLNELVNFYGVTPVCAVNAQGVGTAYSEWGANLWICAPSNDLTGSFRPPHPSLTTTGNLNGYTNRFGGTSGATPIVSGVIALIRSAYPDLTWRDVKLILAGSAHRNDASHTGWEEGQLQYDSTSERYWFNYDYGFGTVDAKAAIDLAETWETLPRFRQETAISTHAPATLYGPSLFDTTVRKTLTLGSHVGFIEFVAIEVTLAHEWFRDLRIELISPAGTTSVLTIQVSDVPGAFEGTHRFGSAKHLGESAAGEWTLVVRDERNPDNGVLDGWKLTVYGHGYTPFPPSITSSSPGSESITLNWTAPSDDGGSTVTGYDVRYIRTDVAVREKNNPDNWTVEEDIWSSGTLTYEVTGLLAGVRYDFQLRASNESGSGHWSDTYEEHSTEVEPSAPTDVAVAPRDTELRVTWARPETGSEGIRSYDIRRIRSDATDKADANWTVTTGAWTSGELLATVGGLDNDVAYDVQVRAVNNEGTGPWTSTVTGTPAILNGPPEFTQTLFTITFPENQAAGPIGSPVTATDSDSTDLTYSLADDTVFDIDAITGQIKSRAAHDRETPPVSYAVTVQVTDGRDSNDEPDDSIDDTISGTVEVTNVNEAPVFQVPGMVSLQVEENSTGVLAAYPVQDPDAGDTLTFSLGGPDAGDFTLTNLTLSFASPPDFEAPADANRDNTYEVSVGATDSGGLTTWAATVVEVTPVEEPPEVTGTETLTVKENTTAVATYRASDPEGVTSTFAWSLGGDDSGDFAISSGGALRFSPAPDFEAHGDLDRNGVYEVTVQATDEAATDADARTGELAVRVTVEDVDEPPEISGTASYRINENGPTFVGSYTATDPEGSDVTWESLAGSDAGHFQFTESGGSLALNFKASPDYEARSDDTYEVQVRASDEGGKIGGLLVTVTVVDQNEPPEISGPETIDVNEGHTGTLGTFTKRDPEGQATNWGAAGGSEALTGADAAEFAFNQATGALTFVDPPDFETGQAQYSVTVNANDGVSSDAYAVTVNVANVEESGSLSLGAQRGVLNVPLVATLTDPDGIVSEEWQWQRSASRGGPWTDIDGATLSSYTPVAPDRDEYLRATVTYEDGFDAGNPANAVTEFTTANQRGSNTAPALPASVDDIAIPEDSRPGRSVGAPVRATDNENDPLVYTLSGASEFVIGRTTGQIAVAADATFDFDTPPTSYTVTVTADDGFGGQDTVDVTINLENVNEPPVAVDDAPAGFNEDTSTTIDVLDNDSDPEDEASDLTVSIQRRPSNGSVAVNAPVNPGERPTVTYTPRANYHGSDSFTYRLRDTGNLNSSVATVALTIDAVNDAPVFAEATAERSVSEVAEAGEELGAPLTATDIDGDLLTYSLSGGSGNFDIDEHSGQISVAGGAALNAGTQPEVVVTVTASDPDGLTADIEVTITVTARPVTPFIFIPGLGGPTGPEPSELEFEWNVTRDIEALASGHDNPSGMWSDGAVLYLLDNASGAGDAVYAYDLESGERVEDREFELAETNRAPRGIWSDGETVWVSDSGQDRLFAHDLATGERLADRDIELASRNRDARGIWSGEGTMWVLDGGKDSLFAYDLASGAFLGEYALDASNDDPRGIWSDGHGVWVSNHDPKRLFAYVLPVVSDEPAGEVAALERVESEEFTRLSSASNNSPRGIWSDGAVMYVADESDDRVYTFNMPDAIDASLASLSLSGVDIGEFSPLQTDYEGIAGEGVTETTVEAAAAQAGASVVIEPGDADEEAEGHPVALAGVAEITVTVTSPDGIRRTVYRVALGESSTAASCLRGAVNVGFSLVVYEGGSVDELVACAQDRNVSALYVLQEGEYVSYIAGAPAFVNREFRERFPAGVAALTPLTVRSAGPASAAPAAAAATQEWPACLRGELGDGFSLVLYEGGGVDALAACAEDLGLGAVYTLHEGEWVALILGAPDFVNRRFFELYPDGLPPATPLVVRRESLPGP